MAIDPNKPTTIHINLNNYAGETWNRLSDGSEISNYGRMRLYDPQTLSRDLDDKVSLAQKRGFSITIPKF